MSWRRLRSKSLRPQQCKVARRDGLPLTGSHAVFKIFHHRICLRYPKEAEIRGLMKKDRPLGDDAENKLAATALTVARGLSERHQLELTMG